MSETSCGQSQSLRCQGSPPPEAPQSGGLYGTRLVVDTLFILVMVPFLDALFSVIIHPEAVCETTEPSPWWENVLDDHQGC